ncbi:MAG: hypothetical protein EA412_12500 [Chitinophagaceae bacterium]|nr:MAG: hypothetical protein EA412_12500 [Chitinophagaceae bacterium]
MNQQLTNQRIFPLGIILFEKEQSYLHIFEPKYLQLIKDALNSDYTFAIPYVEDGVLTEVASLVKVKQIVKRYPNGTFDIAIEGLGNYFMDMIHSGDKLYETADISRINTDTISGITLTTLFQMFMEKKENIEMDDERFKLSYIASRLPLNVQERFNFLNTPRVTSKQKFLITQIRFQLFISEIECRMEYNFSLN